MCHKEGKISSFFFLHTGLFLTTYFTLLKEYLKQISFSALNNTIKVWNRVIVEIKILNNYYSGNLGLKL